MKKSYLFGMFALAAMTMVGCSNDEVVENFSQDNAIEFGTYMGRDVQSRAEIFETSDLQADGVGFGVFAYYTGQTAWKDYTVPASPNFMNNTHVTYTAGTNEASGSWTYSPLKYWPNNVGDKVSFFAYAPYSTTADKYMGVDKGIINLKVPNEVKNQIDLTAVTHHKIDQTKTTLDQKVEFKFNHVLTRIQFTLQAAADQVEPGGTINEGTTITLNSVTIGGTKEGQGGFYDNGFYSIFDNTWTNCTGNQAFTLDADDFIEDSNILTSEDGGNDKREIVADGSYIMVIPQFVEGFPVTVNYTVHTADNDANAEDDSSTITNNITTIVKGLHFEANRVFRFNLVLGMSTVELSATVGTWDDGNNHQVDLPLNQE